MALILNKVLISEPVDSGCAKILTDNGMDVTTKTGLSKDQLIQEIKHYDGLVVRSATKVTADIIAAGKNLKVIGRAGVGVDNIDCDAATRHGVLVINAPGGNTLSAAELTCGMIMSLSRNIPRACASLKGGAWDRKSFMGYELQGKTLAIVGLGRIGREVAHRMQSFGMKTIGFDPLVPAEVSQEFGVESLELEQIWPLADYITVHTPLIPQTKNLINNEVFSKCRKGVKIVNVARGGIVDEDALVTALESGQCGGAGFDVFLEEPPKNTKLIQHPNMICTPHLGASTVEAQIRVAEEIACQFVDLKAGRFAHGVVNSPAFCQSTISGNRRWVAACKNAGAVAATLFPNVTKGNLSFTLKVSGPELNRMEKLFSTAALIGALKQNQIEANFINAPTLAKEKGIEVASVTTSPLSTEAGEHFPTISLIAEAGKERHGVVVSLSGEEPVLRTLDGISFSDPPKLSDKLVLCRGKHSADMIVKLLGTLTEKGMVHSASWSSIFEDRSWCAINTSTKCDTMPNDFANIFDFWAQLHL